MFFLFLIYYGSLKLNLQTYSLPEQVLSINISSLVSILAISFTLSLLIVQYATEKYSTKLINYFIKDKLFWLIFLQYIFSIIINLIVLSFFNNNYTLIDICLFLTVYCFILIMPQIINISNSIQPENLASILMEQCKEKVVFEGFLGDFQSDHSPIRQLYEFSKSMIKNDDYGAISNVLYQSNILLTNKNEKDVSDIIIDNLNSYYYSLFNYSVILQKYEFSKRIISYYSELYSFICENNYPFEKMNKYRNVYRNILYLVIENKLNNMLNEYIKWVEKICIIKVKNYLPMQDEINLFRKDLLVKKEKDDINFLKYSNFEDDMYLFNKIGDYCIDNKLFNYIEGIIVANYNIFNEMFKYGKGEKLIFITVTNKFYILFNYCCTCIDNNNDDFYHSFNYLIMNMHKLKKYKFWLNEVTNFICGAGLYQAECGKCSINSYFDIGYLGRVIAPDEIDALKYIIKILTDIANIEIKNIYNEKTTLLSDKHRMYATDIISTIENLKDWGKQQNVEYIHYVDEKIIELKNNLTQKKSDYII